jgi:tetratricopeptide (TPR) repeat protein
VNIFKSITVVAVLIGTIYLLQQQYKEASALDNLIYQHIQQAHVTSSAYHLNKERALQEHNYKQINPISQVLLQIDQHLQAGEHLEVLAKGNMLLKTDPDNLEVLLRTSIVYLKEQDYDLAQEQLLAIHKASTTAIMQMEAAWYLALLQSQQGQWQQSQKYLQEVIKAPTNYSHSAEELLAQIERQL